MRLVILSSAIAAAVSAARGDAGCNIDLTAKGLPACAQACPEWCWATVIGELQEYYLAKDEAAAAAAAAIPPATPKCRGYECKVVSAVRKAACCNNATECASSGHPLHACGNPSSPEEIMLGFQEEVPSQTWVHMHGRPGWSCTPADGCYPTEPVLQSLLMGGAPVARATHGHITALAGCRQSTSGVVEYRVLDSLQDPEKPLWMNYTLLTLGPPPGKGDGPWQDTYYSNSSAGGSIYLTGRGPDADGQ
jgi:hypothetical protein